MKMESKALIVRPSAGPIIRYQPTKFNTSLLDISRFLWNHRDKFTNLSTKVMEYLRPTKVVSPDKRKGGRKNTFSQIGDNSQYEMKSAPLARGLTVKNLAFLRFGAAPKNIGDEVQGIRLVGRQFFCGITNFTADAGAFASVTGGATLLSDNTIRISPDALNGRVALISRNFDRYVFRYLRFVYTPYVAATTHGTFAMCLTPDGALPLAVTFNNVVQTVPSTMTTVWVSADLEVFEKGDDLFYTLLDTTNSATIRQTCQGVLNAEFSSAASTSNVPMGLLTVEYVLDLYDPSGDMGFTLEKIRMSDEDYMEFLSWKQKKDGFLIVRK